MTTTKNGRYPYWRLSSVYFFYFAVVGALSPYWALYLMRLGYSPSAIGFISAIPMITKLVAPNLWGLLADRSGKRLLVIRLGAFGACLGFLGLFYRQDFWWLAAFTFAYSFFWNAILAQFEVETLCHLGDSPHQYSRVRLWGSVGFIVTVLLLGYALEVVPVSILPFVVFVFLLGIFFSTVSMPAVGFSHDKSESSVGLMVIILQPRVLIFFMVFALLQMSHGVYYTFYSIHLENFGYGRGVIGFLWALGVIAEIVIFLRMPQLMSRFSAKALVMLSLVLTGLRWIAIGWFPEQTLLIYFVQLIHAFSFGVTHAVAIEFVRQNFGHHQGQGQALYSAVCFGAGNAIGAYLSGVLWEISYSYAFIMSVLTIVFACLLLALLKPEKPVHTV